MTQTICGVDISSRTLDVSLGARHLEAQFPNTLEGIRALAQFCLTHNVTLVAMEATGGYEQKAQHGLTAAGLAVAILNPRAVRQ
ncbi:MAG: IS110 family transposase [Acidobacteriaceae bacterium]